MLDPRQEFHQEMLRKLALHLAAQPDGNPVPGPAGPGPGAVAPVAAAPAEAQEESPERVNHFCDVAVKCGFSKNGEVVDDMVDVWLRILEE